MSDDNPLKSAAETGVKSYAAKAALGALGAAGVASFPVVVVVVVVVIVIFCGFGVLFGPLLTLLGAGGAPPNNADEIAAVIQGDGKGELDATTVPEDLLESIQQAGALCGQIGPVVIAAQLQHASGFDQNFVSADGAEGIAQLPPAEFTRFAQDEDDNGEISPFDPEDAIMALGRFDCALAEQVQGLVLDGNAAEVLSLTLAAVKVGAPAVQAAGGIPAETEPQAYVAGVRAQLPKFQGLFEQQQ